MKKLLVLLALTMASISLAQADEITEVINDDGISKKWEFKFDGALSTNFKGNDNEKLTTGDDNIMFNIGGGYNFNSNIFLGLSTGYYPSCGVVDSGKLSKANYYIPFLADFVYRWNIGTTGKWSIFAQARGGYLFSVRGDCNLSKDVTYEYPNSGYIDLQPGFYYRLRPNIDIRFSVGYAYLMPADDTPDITHNENMFIAKVGMNFRKAPKVEIRTTPIEEPVAEPEPVVPKPEPVKIVETTTPEQKSLGEREVVIFYTIRMHNILPEKDDLLMEMALFTKTHKTSKIVLKSYADKGTGNYELNQMYSRNRMNEVRKHLIEKYGINPDQIESSYYGDTVQPFEENDKNRCSIITVKEVE